VKPLAVRRRLDILLRVGAPLVISFSYSGHPQPMFQWYRNGYAVANQTSSSYVVKRTTIDDAGTYTCKIFNIAGEHKWTEAFVNIADE
jgi:hypothetical protein